MNKQILVPLFIIAALLFGACGVNIDINIDKGSGNVITEERNVSGFDRVILTGIGDLTIIQGDTESMEIEAEDNVAANITTEVKNGTLEIGFNEKRILPTEPVKFTVTMRTVRGLDTRGVSNIQSDKIDTDQLDLAISGTGNINLRSLTADEVKIHVSGAGNLNAEGKVTEQKITLSGAGNYNGEDLESETADIVISGLGKVTVWATGKLDVKISGTGSVDYYGNPQVSQNISGLGRLEQKGDK